MDNPRPSRNEIRRRTDALPLVESGEVIDEKTALSTLEALKRHGSQLPDHIKNQIDAIVDEMGAKLDHNPVDNTIPITELQLRGIIARSAIAAAAQTVNDIGQTYVEINEFRELIAITDMPSTNGDYEEPGEPPAA
jgi:hypothetical protein